MIKQSWRVPIKWEANEKGEHTIIMYGTCSYKWSTKTTNDGRLLTYPDSEACNDLSNWHPVQSSMTSQFVWSFFPWENSTIQTWVTWLEHEGFDIQCSDHLWSMYKALVLHSKAEGFLSQWVSSWSEQEMTNYERKETTKVDKIRIDWNVWQWGTDVIDRSPVRTNRSQSPSCHC